MTKQLIVSYGKKTASNIINKNGGKIFLILKYTILAFVDPSSMMRLYKTVYTHYTPYTHSPPYTHYTHYAHYMMRLYKSAYKNRP